MSYPLTKFVPETNAAVKFVVQTSEGPIELEADVTRSQAQKLIEYARSLQSAGEVRPRLSPRERQVLGALSSGLSYKQVAGELKISIDTVRTYVRSLYRKLGAHSVTEAIARAREFAWSERS